jgi:hypothetical protein
MASLFCALFRHSHLVTNCFGYKHCARCKVLLGDSLGGAGLPTGPGGYFQIGQSCNCEECRQAFDSLTWIDKFMCPKAVFPAPGGKERRLAELRAHKDELLRLQHEERMRIKAEVVPEAWGDLDDPRR